jgi:oligoendopeptidase F
MNIRARFGFERRLYALRREGILAPDTLSAEMLACQREAYGDALGSYFPRFWASKLHFYIASFGFYNWPYTFGFLFSREVYRRAAAGGDAFLPVLVDLLRRTGHGQTEALAADALGVDLTDPAFWQGAVADLDSAVDRLEALAAEVAAG